MRKAHIIEQSTGTGNFEQPSLHSPPYFLNYPFCEEDRQDMNDEDERGNLNNGDIFDDLININEQPYGQDAGETPQINVQDNLEEPGSIDIAESQCNSQPAQNTTPKPRKPIDNQNPKGKAQAIVQVEENFYHKFKKNVNMPKAIGRYLMDHYHHFEHSLFAQDQKFYEQLALQLEDRKIWVRCSKKNSIKLKDLEYYFSNRVRTRRESCLTRLMMRKIIEKWSREEIIPNNQVKGKLEYLVATKVYALRCSNSILATRMQMR